MVSLKGAASIFLRRDPPILGIESATARDYNPDFARMTGGERTV